MYLCVLILTGCSDFDNSVGADDKVKLSFELNGPPSRSTTEAYLSRAVTMSDFFTGHPDNLLDIEEGIRFVTNTGAKFLGRTAFIYANEELLDEVLSNVHTYAVQVHEADPEVILQAAIFEVITPSVNSIKIPEYVLTAFSQESDDRTFNYSGMLFDPDGPFAHNTNVFGPDLSVPDITKQETQLWYYFLASSYINAGIEAIHLGIFDWVSEADTTKEQTHLLLRKVRDYAQQNARRKWVFLDAHTHGIKYEDTLLLDFHSHPLRLLEGDNEDHAILKMNYYDVIYGKSKGGIAPSGWSCANLPYLVEFDHGYSLGSISENTEEYFIWGHDEITWFATRPESVRNNFLEYADAWIRKHDSSGHLQMPALRPIWVNYADHPEDFYYAMTASDGFELGYGQESTIKTIWEEQF